MRIVMLGADRPDLILQGTPALRERLALLGFHARQQPGALQRLRARYYARRAPEEWPPGLRWVALERALHEQGVPFVAIDKGEEERLLGHGDTLIVVGWPHILDMAVLDQFSGGAFNVHYSLLPFHRGPHPVSAAILSGHEHTGVTVHRLSAETDAGEIVAQRTVPIGINDTVEELWLRCREMAMRLLETAIPAIEAGQIETRPQPADAPPPHLSFNKRDTGVDWRRPAREVHGQIRACAPYNPAWTLAGGRKVLLVSSWLDPKQEVRAGHPPGTCRGEGKRQVWVACGDGLWLKIGWRPGPGKIPAEMSFLESVRSDGR